MNEESGLIGVLLGIVMVIILEWVIYIGGNLREADIRDDINLCGHTLECCEKVIFPKEEEK